MLKSGLVCFVLAAATLELSVAQDQRNAGANNQVILKYLGTAGWEISDGSTVLLIDPTSNAR